MGILIQVSVSKYLLLIPAISQACHVSLFHRKWEGKNRKFRNPKLRVRERSGVDNSRPWAPYFLYTVPLVLFVPNR
jgi:hypothetical protein